MKCIDASQRVVGGRCLYEGVSPGTDEHPLMEDITQQCTGDYVWEQQFLCDGDSCKVVTKVRSLLTAISECSA